MKNPRYLNVRSNPYGDSAVGMRALIVTVMATIAINTPGTTHGMSITASPDVLVLQGAVARMEVQGTHGAERAAGDVLELQRALASPAESKAPEEYVDDAPGLWATIPLPVSPAGGSATSVCTRVVPAGQFTASRMVLAQRLAAPIRSPVRERYLYNLTANAPPVPRDVFARSCIT